MRRLVTNWWFLTVLAVLLLLALVLFGLPIFVHFMRHWWVKASLSALIVLVWGIFAFLRIRRARRANAAIAAELTKTNPADEEEKALSDRMKSALASLKSSGGKRRNYLYNRPWYVIIGPPGAGKTTALLTSGLRFPFSEQKLGGIGGTRNLDFWFADEAVLVDTAGRYTTQDSDETVDASGWRSLLKLLRKHRPLQPINGIIIAIAADELVRSDCGAIDRHAAALRRRLTELKQSLELSAPVYLMVTKADLLAGFKEYFDDLDVEGRRAVLGATLPFTTARTGAEDLAHAFDRMAQSITDRQAKRLFEEPDSQRRSLILGFPAQLRSLRARLMRLVDGAFLSSDSNVGVLRGFYFTSGIQQGAPLDRILSSVADVYDSPAEPATASSGKAYFLNRLLSEVMFTEAGLVQMDPRARARQRVQLVSVIGAVGLAALLTIFAWSVSFAANRSFQSSMLHAATNAQAETKQSGVDLVQVRDSDPDLRQVLPVLDALRNLPRGYQAAKSGGVPLKMRFGLYQSGLARSGEEAYREGLRRIMLPRLLLRLEQVMQTNMNEPMNLYEPLKVYLMLGGQGPMDTKAVRNLITADWENNLYAGADSAPERAALTKHLDALLEDKELSASWANGQAPLHGELVSSTRTLLQTLSPADRAYAILKQKASLAGDPWMMTGFLTRGDAAAFAQPDAVLATKVPYFYTRAGFEKFYTISLATVQRDITKEAWVLGSSAESVRSDIGNIRPGVAGRYARDYIDAWEKVIAVLKPADYFNDQVAFGAFTREPSPLERVLLELRRNTSFEGGASAVAKRAIQQRLGRTRLGDMAGDYNAGRETGLDAGGAISSHFRELLDYVGDGKTASPLRDFVAAVRDAGKAVYAARSAVASGAATDQLQGAMATAVTSVKLAGSSAPSQLHDFVAAAAGGGARAQVTTVQGAVATSWSQVAENCRGVAEQRYPFFGASPQDASIGDMMGMFGPGGTLTMYVDQQLKRLISTDGPVWRWRDNDPVTAAMDPASPEEFAKAAQIRSLLMSGFAVRVMVEKMGSETGAVEISSGNSDQRLDAQTPGPRILSWSPQGNPEAFVVLYPAAAPTPPPAPASPAAAKPGTAASGSASPSTAAKPAAPTPPPTATPPPPPGRISSEGPWAFFRLLDKADKQNAGPQAIRATFRSGAYWATLLLMLPSTQNPFGRGGMWSFRCPTTL